MTIQRDLRRITARLLSRQAAGWMMVALTAATFALRLYHLGASDLTFDESASAFISGKPYLEMLRYLLSAFHELPPGYYVLLRAWDWVAGRGEFALRYPSVMSGVLAVVLTWRLGRRGLGTGTGLVAALLLALQPFQFYYSQDARPYTLMMVEALLMVYCFDRLCREPALRWWLAFGLIGAVAVLTHYFMVFVIAALAAYLVLEARVHRRVAPVWFGGLAAVSAVILIWLITSRAGRLVVRTLSGFTFDGLLARLSPARTMLTDVMFGALAHPSPAWIALMAGLVLIGLAVALACPWRTLRPGGAWLLPAWLIIPIVLLTAVPERLEARYNAAIVPAFSLTLALVVTWLWQRKITRPLALLTLGVLLCLQVNSLMPMLGVIKSDYGHVVAYLNRYARPGDSLVFNGDWQWVQQLYYPAEAYLPRFELPPRTPPGLDPDQARPELERALATSQRIWVLPAAVGETDPKRFVAGWLNEHAYLTSEYHELSLYYVDQSSALPTPLNPPIKWGDWIELAAVRWARNQTVPGEPLLLDLNWRVLRAPERDPRISIGLADRNGGVWYSTQIAPGLFYAPSQTWQAGQQITTRIGIPVPIGTPPGEFAVRVNVVGQSPGTGGDFVALSGAQVLPCSDSHPCRPLLSDDLMPMRVAFGPDLALLGYQVGGAEFTQGRFAAITLYWQAERSLTDDVTERLVLVDRSGREAAASQGPPVADWYPSSHWMPGQLLADPQVILVPPRLAPDEYSFRVNLIAPDGHILGASQSVGRIRVIARERRFSAGAITHRLNVQFGDRVRLLGYDVEYPPAGGQAKLALYWQALREMDENYTVFTHIVDASGALVGQQDSWPRSGDYPTSFWMRGEVVQDEYAIPFSGGAGPYRLQVGLYDATTLVRLPAVMGGERLADDAVSVPLNIER
jgi:mannosyltransferase